MLKFKGIHLRILLILVFSGGFFPITVLAVPIQDEFDKNQAGNYPGVFPKWEGTPPVNKNLHPQLTDGINEPHPLPSYVNRDIYTQLLKVEPIDQVQSKVFNLDRFDRLQRIRVLGFENKTFAPFEDRSAGDVVSMQAYQELKSNKSYSNIIPPQLMGDASLVSGDRVDAVMVGAVSKYTDKYVDRYGKIQKSIASELEFTAFLVDPRTRDVIWGARFVGRQRPGIQNLRQHKRHWLSKEDFTHSAMKFVLKEFRDWTDQSHNPSENPRQ